MDAPEALTFHCDHCGSALTVPRSLAGVTGPCPECGSEITSPSFEPSPEEVWNQEETSVQEPAVQSPDDLTRFFEEDSVAEPKLDEPIRGKSPRRGEKKSRVKVIVGMVLGAGLAVGAWLAFPHVKDLLPQGVEVPRSRETVTDQTSTDSATPEAEIPNEADTPEVEDDVPESDEVNDDVVDLPPPDEASVEDGGLSDLNTEIVPEFPTSGPESALEEPRNFIISYLTAEKWEDLVPVSINGPKLRGAMADYYAKNPYQPEKITDVGFRHKQKLPGREEMFYLFRVITESSLDSFPMTVEETNDGLKTDWETYVQFKDSHLQKFIDNPSVDGKIKTFNVMLRRQHYFRTDVPDPASKLCFRLEAPIQNQEGGAVFVPKEGLRADEFDRELEWNNRYFLIVELKWVVEKGHEDQPYIQLMKIKQFNWRGHDPDFAAQP